jgi:hypothetical protein
MFRTLVILLIAGVAILRGVIPTGFMLASAETPGGRFVVMELCDAPQKHAEAIDLDTGRTIPLADLEKSKRSAQGQSHAPCFFASAPFLVAAATADVAIEPVEGGVEGLIETASGISPAPASPLPPATGPPLAI